jgi:hypothetical protein
MGEWVWSIGGNKSLVFDTSGVFSLAFFKTMEEFLLLIIMCYNLFIFLSINSMVQEHQLNNSD